MINNKYISQSTVLGGQTAEKNEFPWAALLHLKSSETGYSSRCGGSLISDRWSLEVIRHVLTFCNCADTSWQRPTVSRRMLWVEMLTTSGMTSLLYSVRLILMTCQGSSPSQWCAGEHDITDDSETVTVVSKAKPSERHRHPKFFIRRSEGKSNYDVAILELETPLDFTQGNISHIR